MMFFVDRKTNRANNMAYYEHVGYGYRFVLDMMELTDKVTLGEINSFLQSSFTDDAHYISVVGKM